MTIISALLIVASATPVSESGPPIEGTPISAPAMSEAPQPSVQGPGQALPDAVRLMIENALASDNEADIATVVRIAKASHPAAATEIDALVEPWFEKRRQIKQATVKAEHDRVQWDGQGELGGFRSTGTSDELGLSASVNLKRTGPNWVHSLRGRADYRRIEGAKTRENLMLSYEPRLQLSPQAFIYGIVQFEHAPYLGYSERYTASAGFGKKIANSSSVTLSIDTGPSFRSIDQINTGLDDRFGWRASTDFDWKLSPSVTVRQDTNAYVETRTQTVNSLFALDTRLVSRLSARFSYDVRYESTVDVRDDRLDTMSKVTLVYDF